MRSRDAGDSWEVVFDVFNPEPAGGSGRIELAMSPSDTNRIYASFDQSDDRHDIYMSEDAGNTWYRADDVSGSNPAILGNQGWYDQTIAVHPFNPNRIYVGGVRLYTIDISDSSRTTSRIRSSTIPHVDHHNLTLIPFDEANNEFRIINGNDGGVWYSDNDGDNWTHTLTGYNTSQFYGADKRPGVEEYAGGMQDNGTWQSPPGSSAVTAFNLVTDKCKADTIIRSQIKTVKLVSANPFRIAKSSDLSTGSRHFNGLIDEVRIWRVCRTQPEIEAGMFEDISGESGLVGYWNFETGSGDRAFDSSGYGNDGVIHGASWSTDVPTPAEFSDSTWGMIKMVFE